MRHGPRNQRTGAPCGQHQKTNRCGRADALEMPHGNTPSPRCWRLSRARRRRALPTLSAQPQDVAATSIASVSTDMILEVGRGKGEFAGRLLCQRPTATLIAVSSSAQILKTWLLEIPRIGAQSGDQVVHLALD